MKGLRTELNSIDSLHTFAWSECCSFSRAGDDAKEDVVIEGYET
jgi:hypothetical protein